MATCIVCGVHLPPRIPAAPSNEKVRHFLLNVFVSGQIFRHSPSEYSCRPCFAKPDTHQNKTFLYIWDSIALPRGSCKTNWQLPFAAHSPTTSSFSALSSCLQTVQNNSAKLQTTLGWHRSLSCMLYSWSRTSGFPSSFYRLSFSIRPATCVAYACAHTFRGSPA